jgi:hypothetical protein
VLAGAEMFPLSSLGAWRRRINPKPVASPQGDLTLVPYGCKAALYEVGFSVLVFRDTTSVSPQGAFFMAVCCERERDPHADDRLEAEAEARGREPARPGY